MQRSSAIRVLHTESSTAWGGQERRTLTECVGLIRRGHAAAVACAPGSGLAARAYDAGVPVFPVPIGSAASPRAALGIARAAAAFGANLVSSHSSKDCWAAWLGTRLLFPRPVLVRTRHLALPVSGVATYWLPRAVVAVSERVREVLIEGGVAPGKITVIPSGIDLAPFRALEPGLRATVRRELGVGDGERLLIAVGMLRREKGHEYLLRAVSLLAAGGLPVRAVVVGGGPCRGELEREIEALGLGGRVSILGTRGDVPRLLSAADVYVVSSVSEGMGQATMEAMAAGVPVVATAVGGLPELVRNEETGVLVAPADPEALARGIRRVLSDVALARRLAGAARALVEREYSAERYLDRVEELYARLLRGEPGGGRA